MFKLLIADDNESMRLVLKKAAAHSPEITQIDEVSDGAQAVAAFDHLLYDIAFLDVDMPNLNGIEAAKLIMDIHPKCKIVFITAHDDYMQEAFALYAFDYIVKPFKLDRLNMTLKKLLELPVEVIEKKSSNNLSSSDQLLLRVKEGMVRLNPNDIIFIERRQRQTVIITESGEYTVSKTLTELETLLNRDIFLRSHKSYIINLHRIHTLTIYGRWTYIVKFLGTSQDALLTKEQSHHLSEAFKIIE